MMINNIDNTTPTIIRAMADDFERIQNTLYLAKQALMVRFKNSMSTTDWAKELGAKSNKTNEALMEESLLEKIDVGWKPTEKGKDYFTNKKGYTPILTEKGAMYIIDMLCDGRLPFCKISC